MSAPPGHLAHPPADGGGDRPPDGAGPAATSVLDEPVEPVEGGPADPGADPFEIEMDVDADDGDDGGPPTRVERARAWLREVHPAAWLTALAALLFAVVFGRLGVQNHRNFGTWSYDMGIYDQALWLVSRGGDTFMSVRGLDVWGHHVNLIAYAFAPAYWLGAGPEFLYVVQAAALALGAVPVYLIARDRLGARPWWGFLFACVYLMYAPIQWISWAMFHPEALVIAPFLFAWWFGTRERWSWYFVMLFLVLSMREDVALAVIVMGVVLAVRLRGSDDRRRAWTMCGVTAVAGAAWYLLATRVVLPHFNDGKEPFYITYFYGHYGSSLPEIASTIVTRPDLVVHDALQADRKDFYKDLLMPLGATPLANPFALLMAGPQLLASVIGTSPYARMIRYQYTSVMIAPLVISAIDGARVVLRHRAARFALPVWMVLCSYVTNVMLSPSPLAPPATFAVWSRDSPRNESLRAALAVIPEDAAVSATYQLLPHLSHRLHVYDWPNPFTPAVWGNDDCDQLPSPTTIDHVALDKTQIGENNRPLYEAMFAPGGPFQPIFEDENVIVGERVGTDPAVDVQPQRGSCQEVEARRAG